jgi:hypothetical protein
MNKYHNTRANEFDAMVGEIEFETALQYAKGDSVELSKSQ